MTVLSPNSGVHDCPKPKSFSHRASEIFIGPTLEWIHCCCKIYKRLINCFPDLGELCWHVKRLRYIAECRHAVWSVGCTALGLHSSVLGKQVDHVEKAVCVKEPHSRRQIQQVQTWGIWLLTPLKPHANQNFTTYMLFPVLSLVFCCFSAFLAGNIVFDPPYLVYRVSPSCSTLWL